MLQLTMPSLKDEMVAVLTRQPDSVLPGNAWGGGVAWRNAQDRTTNIRIRNRIARATVGENVAMSNPDARFLYVVIAHDGQEGAASGGDLWQQVQQMFAAVGIKRVPGHEAAWRGDRPGGV